MKKKKHPPPPQKKFSAMPLGHCAKLTFHFLQEIVIIIIAADDESFFCAVSDEELTNAMTSIENNFVDEE